jgi:hypothetical protein
LAKPKQEPRFERAPSLKDFLTRSYTPTKSIPRLVS